MDWLLLFVVLPVLHYPLVADPQLVKGYYVTMRLHSPHFYLFFLFILNIVLIEQWRRVVASYCIYIIQTWGEGL